MPRRGSTLVWAAVGGHQLMHRLCSTVEEKMELGRLVGQSILAAGGDAVGIIRIWNPGAERIFGYDADEAVGQSLD